MSSDEPPGADPGRRDPATVEGEPLAVEATGPGTAQSEALRWRNRLILIALFAGVFGPMVVAMLLYRTGWIEGARTNHGELLDPVRPVAELSSALPDRPGLWSLVLRVGDACADPECRGHLDRLRRLHLLLNRDVARVERVLVTERAAAAAEALRTTFPRLRVVDPGTGTLGADGPVVFLVDPLGNVVLRYRPDQIGEALLEDLEHLLDLSGIG